MIPADARRGLVVGDVLLGLAVLALLLALAAPRIQRSALRRQVDEAVAHVQEVVGAANRFHEREARWPDPADAGTTPAGLATYLPEGFSFDHGGYDLDLEVWTTAEEAPARPMPADPPTAPIETPPDSGAARPSVLFGSLAGVTVHSMDPRLLAGLLEHFGDGRSFLYDGAWTLVFASVPGR